MSRSGSEPMYLGGPVYDFLVDLLLTWEDIPSYEWLAPEPKVQKSIAIDFETSPHDTFEDGLQAKRESSLGVTTSSSNSPTHAVWGILRNRHPAQFLAIAAVPAFAHSFNQGFRQLVALDPELEYDTYESGTY